MSYDAKPFDILPGIFKEGSGYAAQGRYIDGENVRFWKGYPERIGGNQAVLTNPLFFPARGMRVWQSLSGTQLGIFGHAKGAQVYSGGALYDVSPAGANGYATVTLVVTTVSGAFTSGETVTTTAGASGTLIEATADSPMYVVDENGTLELTVTDISGTFLAGEKLSFSGGGVAWCNADASASPFNVYANSGTISGTVTGTVSGATATVSSTAELWTGTVTGGTSGQTCTASSWSMTNRVDSGSQNLWGEGTWGSSVWGGSATLFSEVNNCATWTFGKWGEDMIGCPRGGKIYILDTSVFEGDTSTNMSLMSANAPSDALGVFMNDANRTLIAYGAHDGTASDPLNIAWCDEEDYTTWTAAATNTAGSIRCESGSEIVGVMTTPDGYLISTDKTLYTFRYVGLPFVFSLKALADGSTMIGPHASAEMDSVTYWMNKDGFYAYDGSVFPLPCDVHAYVFGRLNVVQAHKVVCGTNRAFNEVWWWYVSSNATEIDSYVCYNTVERTWHIGSKARTSWVDTSVILSYPMSAKPDQTIQADEIGTEDDGTALAYTLDSGDLEIEDGMSFLHNRMLIPDYDRITGTHTVTIETRGFPQRAARTKGPFNITNGTEKISVRARGRTIRLAFAGSDDFRFGRWRYRITGHGARE